MKAVLNTFLNFGGNCREAFTFYEKNLDGKILAMMTLSEAPPGPDNGMSRDSIIYGHVQIGDSHLMGSDAPPNFQPIRSSYVSLGLFSNEDAERAYNVLKDGGEVFMPLAETFFAHRFAMLRDKFGVLWMIIHGKQPPAAQA